MHEPVYFSFYPKSHFPIPDFCYIELIRCFESSWRLYEECVWVVPFCDEADYTCLSVISTETLSVCGLDKSGSEFSPEPSYFLIE